MSALLFATSLHAQTDPALDLQAEILAEELTASLAEACRANTAEDAMLTLIGEVTQPFEVALIVEAIRRIGPEENLCAFAVSALASAGQAANAVLTANAGPAPGTVATGEDVDGGGVFGASFAPLEGITPPGGAGGSSYTAP